MRTTLIYIIGVIALAAAVSCNNNGCLENQSALPLAGMYSAETGKPISVDGLAISGVGAPGDSVLSDDKSVRQIYLPMRSTANSVEWCFHYNQGGIDSPEFNDTIAFDYTSQPFFAGEECGAMFFYTITAMRHTSHLIDSVSITDSLITNLDIERIQIFFRTESGDNEQKPTDPLQ